AGAGYELSVHTWNFPLWDSCLVRRGWTIRLTKSGFGMWAYLAMAGGIQLDSVLGSRSTYLRGHFGGLNGRLLQGGAILLGGDQKRPLEELAARTVKEAARPAYGGSPSIEVIPGPQVERFDQQSLQKFLSNPWRVNLSSDRMGYRFEGLRLNHVGGADITSE